MFRVFNSVRIAAIKCDRYVSLWLLIARAHFPVNHHHDDISNITKRQKELTIFIYLFFFFFKESLVNFSTDF